MTYMVCDLKVHVRVFNCESLQGSNIRPRESFFWVRDFAKEFFRESFAKVGFYESPEVQYIDAHAFDVNDSEQMYIAIRIFVESFAE